MEMKCLRHICRVTDMGLRMKSRVKSKKMYVEAIWIPGANE